MSISIYQLGYKKLSQIIFEWQVADRTSLLALFIFIEVALHWLWFLVVWFCQDTVEPYVDMHLFYPLWLGVTVTGVLLWWMIGYLARIKSNYKRLLRWQIVLVLLYTVYITAIIVMVGYSSLVAGVSLISGAILGMMLVKRRYVWRIFLLQIFLVLLAIISPYFGISLPNLRQMPVISPLIDIYNYLTYNEIMTIENAIAAFIFTKETLRWDDISELQRSSTFFWRSTHVYLALPKALFTVYIFRKLLYILDESRKEILEHAHKDELTTLDNRRYGLTQMQQTLAAATNTQDYSVILLDLDLFKEINDSYGHQVGDQVLREVADVLIASLAATDAIISRYGGEEFLIVLPNTAHAETLSIAEQLRESIAAHIIQTEEKASVKVTASLGVYTLTAEELAMIKEERALEQKAVLSSQTRTRSPAFSQNNENGSANALSDIQQQLPKDICQYLISSADKALYEAKDRGRNEVVSANDLLAAEV